MTGRGRGRPILGQGTMGRQPGGEADEYATNSNSQQPQSVLSNLSANAVEFVPLFSQTTAPTSENSRVDPAPTSEESSVDAVDVLRQTIFLLTEDPAGYEESVATLVFNLQGSIHNEETLQNIVEELFNQCVNDANFRYTGARVCNHLSHILTVQFTSGNFRQHLLKRCHTEHQKREELIKQSQNRMVGFTLFMGEMLVNFTISNNQRLKILSDAVQELLQTLLSDSNEATLKCVAQVLKLCGSILNEMEKTHNEATTPKLDGILSKLKRAVIDDSLPRSIRSLLLSVIELRASNWGEQESSASNTSAVSHPQNTDSFENSPVFYDSRGQVISAAEAGYNDEELEQNAAFYDQYGQSGDAPYLHQNDLLPAYQNQFSNDDEFDEEIAAAYEEFLLNQQNQKPWSTAD